MSEERPYNPLDYENLTRNLVQELMTRAPQSLPPEHRFKGPGVYAIFYDGPFAPYAPVKSPDATAPIYVGSAVPEGARKGGALLAEEVTEPVLWKRLKQHAKTISEATNLKLGHFRCRYLVVVPLWVQLAERFLIEHYRPVWNVCIEGFGLHDPGSGRHAGELPWWDVLHAGRAWAAKLNHTRTMEDAIRRLQEFLQSLRS